MNERVDQLSFTAEFFDFFVGSWKNQATIYLTIFVLGSLAGLLGAFSYHLNPQKLALLVVGFTALMVFIIPAVYLLIQRVQTGASVNGEVQLGERKGDDFVRRIHYLPQSTGADLSPKIIHVMARATAEGIWRREDLSTGRFRLTNLPTERPPYLVFWQSQSETFDKDFVFACLSQEFEEATTRLLLASPNLSGKKESELRKNLDKSFGFVLWFVAYVFWKEKDAPDVSWDEAVKTYVTALEEAQK